MYIVKIVSGRLFCFELGKYWDISKVMHVYVFVNHEKIALSPLQRREKIISF